MPPLYATLLAIIVSAAASIILFLRIKLNNIIGARDFLWHYAFAFLITSFSSYPVFLINLGVNISQDGLTILYSLSTLAILISYLLFFRGTVLLFTRDRLFTTMLPLVFLPVVSIFSLIALFYLGLPTIVIYTAFLWGFLLVNNNILGAMFFYSFANGAPLKTMKGKPCALLLSLGWYFILGLDFFLWFTAVSYHPELWILKISSMSGWYLLRVLAYLIILAGALFCARRIQAPKREE
ncbi:MAG: hypothetical protein ABIG08_03560 [bacterium]